MSLVLFSAALAAGIPGPNLRVGDAAYLFSLPAINEDAAMQYVARTSVALSDFTGVMPGFPSKAVVVHFFQQAGSESQLATLGRLHKKYASKGVRTVAVLAGPGDIAAVSGWVEAQRLDFPVLRDVHGIVVGRYGVAAYPMTFVVDGEGDVAAIGSTTSELEAGLESVLGGLVGR